MPTETGVGFLYVMVLHFGGQALKARRRRNFISYSCPAMGEENHYCPFRVAGRLPVRRTGIPSQIDCVAWLGKSGCEFWSRLED